MTAMMKSRVTWALLAGRVVVTTGLSLLALLGLMRVASMPVAAVMVGVMLTIATALPVVTVDSPMAGLGDLITLIYLFAIARFFFAISGLDTGSPFTAIGASREAMLGVLVEPILLLGLWVAAQVAGSTHISSITDTIYHWPVARTLPLILALCACAFATFIEMGKLPFDLAEAEQELQEGPLTEYSGYGFAVLKWGISLKQLVVLQMSKTAPASVRGQSWPAYGC